MAGGRRAGDHLVLLGAAASGRESADQGGLQSAGERRRAADVEVIEQTAGCAADIEGQRAARVLDVRTGESEDAHRTVAARIDGAAVREVAVDGRLAAVLSRDVRQGGRG